MINLIFVCLSIVLSFNQIAFADDKKEEAAPPEQFIYAGVMMGVNSSATSDGKISDNSATPAMALTAGIKGANNFGFALHGTYFGRTSTGKFLDLPAGTSAGTTMLLAQGNYFFLGARFGLEMGFAASSWSNAVGSLKTGSTSDTSVVYGPSIGYDIRINRSFSVGADVHYLFGTAKNSVNNIQALASFKMWI